MRSGSGCVTVCFGILLGVVFSASPLAAQEAVRHRVLCVDNGSNRLVLVDQLDPARSWVQPLPAGSRDLQVVVSRDGHAERVLVSHGNGAAEYDVSTGRPTGWVVSRYSGIQTAVRLPGGHTLLGAMDGTVYEVDADGVEKRIIRPQEKIDIRLMRVLETGNIILAGAAVRCIIEMEQTGRIVKKIPLPGKGYKAVRLQNGNYLASTGDACLVVEVDETGKVLRSVGGKAEHPELGLDFVSGWDQLPGGNIMVANWLGHGKHGTGCHLVEFSRDNRVVWKWQDHKLARQVTNVLVLE